MWKERKDIQYYHLFVCENKNAKANLKKRVKNTPNVTTTVHLTPETEYLPSYYCYKTDTTDTTTTVTYSCTCTCTSTYTYIFTCYLCHSLLFGSDSRPSKMSPLDREPGNKVLSRHSDRSGTRHLFPLTYCYRFPAHSPAVLCGLFHTRQYSTWSSIVPSSLLSLSLSLFMSIANTHTSYLTMSICIHSNPNSNAYSTVLEHSN